MTQIAWITGAAGGIGSAVCQRLTADGWHVVGIDLVAAPEAATSVICDLSDADAVTAAIPSILAPGAPTAVIHLAADQPLAGAGQLSAERWRASLQTNVVSFDMLVGAATPGLAANGGTVIPVTSVHANATTAGIAAYATAKAALEGWVRAASMDLGPQIRVNALAAGAVDTPKLKEGFARWGTDGAARRAILEERTPLHRIAQASEVAGAVAFLVGPDSRYMTGSVLTVDGGALARLGTE